MDSKKRKKIQKWAGAIMLVSSAFGLALFFVVNFSGGFVFDEGTDLFFSVVLIMVFMVTFIVIDTLEE